MVDPSLASASLPKETSKAERHLKPTYGFARLTNFAKACLIAQASQERPITKVLDLGCGRGSDAVKFAKAGAESYEGWDSTPAAIEQGRSRREASNARRPSRGQRWMPVSFKVSEMESLCDGGSAIGQFGVISSFNAMHHVFWQSDIAWRLLTSIERHLEPGGFFIGIFPDGERIRAHLKHSNFTKGKVQSGVAPHWSFECLCSIDASHCLCRSYTFRLRGTFDHLVEPFVDLSAVDSHCKRSGLSLEFKETLGWLADWSHLNIQQRSLWAAMGVTAQPLIGGGSDLELANLYTCVVYRKIDQCVSDTPSREV